MTADIDSVIDSHCRDDYNDPVTGKINNGTLDRIKNHVKGTAEKLNIPIPSDLDERIKNKLKEMGLKVDPGSGTVYP